MAPDESIPVVATECLAQCKNGPVAILCRESTEVMIAGFGAQDSVNKIRDFAIQAFKGTNMPLDQIPFRHYPPG
jgi:(2Fe-2S) ferredoxin